MTTHAFLGSLIATWLLVGPAPVAAEELARGGGGLEAARTRQSPRVPRSGQRFEVLVRESVLRRDAVSMAAVVGRVVRGDEVTFLDFIDRRLRILNVLLFDGGHWIKVRAESGAIGWVPARVLRRLP